MGIDMRKSMNTALYCATALATLGFVQPQIAVAQDITPDTNQSAEDQSSSSDSTIIVTARRRDESIVDVPLAITVVGSEKLQQLGITSTTDLANYVPGLQFSDYTPGDSRNDRGRARPLIFRGINVGQGGSVTAAGGMFLDGAAVVGNEVPAGLDIGAVEVLRGPQSVYFGRSSMTGAVSYRTREIPDRWSAIVEITVAQRDMRRLEASIAGPIVADIMKVRLTGLTESTDGYVTNAFAQGANNKLGARSRDSISGALDITPSDSLELKAYANYFRDEDGPAQTSFIRPAFSNCLRPGATRPTICGKIPEPSNSVNYLATVLPDAFSNILFNSPLLEGTGFKRQVGLQREVFNSHLVANWQISDYLRAQSITGYHTNATITVQDGIGQPFQPNFAYSEYFYSLTNRTRDFSQELRLSSDPDRAFSWTAGTNYVNAIDQVQAYVGFRFNPAGNFLPIPQSLGTNGAKTYGFFGGAYLKLADERLTLSAEGRYQIDNRRQRQQNGTTFAETINLREKFTSFSPRVSVDYALDGDKKIYASYASGTRPGGFNSLLLTYFRAPVPNPVVIQQINDLLGVTDETYAEERLKIGELGFKGSFADGRGFFDINAYYGRLVNQQVSQGALIPALGFTVTAITNVGETEVYGIEFQGNFNLTPELSLSTTAAWNHATRTSFINQGGLAQFGTTDLSGVEMANTPELTYSSVLTYDTAISADWDFFANASYVYRGSQWTDAANLSYIDGRHQVDLRAGVKTGGYTIEAFALNLLNDRSYTSGSVAPDFGQSAPALQFHAFFGGVAPPRQFGLRLRGEF